MGTPAQLRASLEKYRQNLEALNKLKFTATGRLTAPITDFSVQTSAPAEMQALLAEFQNIGTAASGDLSLTLKTDLDSAIAQVGAVDTGALRDSLSLSFQGSNIDITYNVEYAGLIHYGGYITPYGNPNARPVYIAGRPWVDNTLNTLDIEAIYYKYANL